MFDFIWRRRSFEYSGFDSIWSFITLRICGFNRGGLCTTSFKCCTKWWSKMVVISYLIDTCLQDHSWPKYQSSDFKLMTYSTDQAIARDWWRETSFTVLESSFNYNIYMYSNIFDLSGQRLLLYIALSMIRKKLFDSSVSQNNKQIILPSEAKAYTFNICGRKRR